MKIPFRKPKQKSRKHPPISLNAIGIEIPGSLVYIGEKQAGKPYLCSMQYCEDEYHESIKVYRLADLPQRKSEKTWVNWLNLEGLANTELVAEVGKKYNLHNLLLEDVLNTYHRPKIEDFEAATLVIAKMLTYNKEEKVVESEQISFALTADTLITFQQWDGDVFEQLRERIRHKQGKIRLKGTAYLLFALLDAIVTNYYNILEQIESELEELENDILEHPKENALNEVHHYKRQLATIRKAAFPTKEVINSILKGTGKMIKEENELYFRDLYDNISQVVEQLDHLKEMANSLQDLCFSNLSGKMNNIMKTLTIVSSIFIPLTFIAGVYGMNFDFLPELHWKYGYLMFWVLALAIAGLLAYIFKRLDWW